MAPSETLSPQTNRLDLTRLERMAGFLVRLAQLRIYDSFHAELGARGITPARYSLLAVLHDNPDSRPGLIAEAMRVKPSNLASLLTQFEQEGLILRVPDPAERRAALIRLSDAGETLFAEVDPIVHALEARAVSMLTPNEAQTLLRLLSKIAGA